MGKKFNVQDFQKKLTETKEIKEMAEEYYKQILSPTLSQSSVELNINQISPNPYNPRRYINPTKIEELKQSIVKVGLINPIIVTESKNLDFPDIQTPYIIICGERRWRACKELGYETIPCIIKNLNNEQAKVISFLDNVIREDISYLEEAEFYQRELPSFNHKQSELAKFYNMPEERVSELLLVANLPEEIKSIIRSNETFTYKKAIIIGRIKDPKEQIKLANLVALKDISVRTLIEHYKKSQTGEKRKKSSFVAIRILPNKNGYDLIIKFRKDRIEDLDKIIDVVSKKLEEIKRYKEEIEKDVYNSNAHSQ